ncbi:MAG: gluconeogenesis factor YvcK family protein [Candidatus Paceibacterota bacterium]
MTVKKSVVVIGGGTGTHTILRGLKHFSHTVDITAIVGMSDSGGSTGRLRDEFGMLPVGDARMAMAALADDSGVNELLMRDLFLYRFQNGNGLKGHNLGNLLLTALSDMLGNEAVAIAAASQILRLSGTVLPITTDKVHLTALYDDYVEVEGEHKIDAPLPDRYGHRIIQLGLRPEATIHPAAMAALSSADMIIIGPGDLYSSLLANCVVTGVPQVIKNSRAKFVYVANLMERLGQTEGMTVSDCVRAIEKYVGKQPDVVVVNDASLPQNMIERYKKEEGTRPVVDDIENDSKLIVVRTDLISHEDNQQPVGDQVRRSLIRHDSDKLAAAVLSVLNS